ncbi:unnamed protein product [Ostreobium quekettii]|uniref:Acyl-CoA dehydrogenase n=1 Tax=Ostreobium quekettii TaxID=121088 RepID=A0A8S1IJU9_9CHLO|nr:unnamed protein product [Ostreobium quekettii]|eukprot:evm.model.scf_5.22 EVM.evm.TU.scf_5.22   scf_5:276335-288302(+)
MAFETSSNTHVPSPVLAIDEGRLLDYLADNVPSFMNVQRLVVLMFDHGRSNPTYLIKTGAKQYVLRKKPPGQLLPSAHKIEREYQVIAALQDTRVPVPRAICLCNQAAVIGTPFYVMEHVQGTIFVDPNLPSLSSSQRRAVYWQMAAALASLHDVKPSDVGLGRFGHPTGYCRRQVERWWKQYRASVADVASDEVTQLKQWLESNIPRDDGLQKAGHITHGDFRIDNLVFSNEDEPRVKAILDWELSTLGDPWADVAYSCLQYYGPRSSPLAGISSPCPDGIPTEDEYVGWYCSMRGVKKPSRQQWAFYAALALFRIAAITQGVYARALQGNGVSEGDQIANFPKVVDALACRALEIIRLQDTAQPASRKSELQISALGKPSVSGTGFDAPPRVRTLAASLHRFMEETVLPAEEVLNAHACSPERWAMPPVMQELKRKAKQQRLWNLWLPSHMASEIRDVVSQGRSKDEADLLLGPCLSNLEYSHLSEIMGSSQWAPEVFNCSAPDTGNMELLARFGSPEQQRKWLIPLLDGSIRSCFAMTEKAVASSDATNIQSSIVRDGDWYVVSGRKWWISGAMHPLCRICIFMGKTNLQASTYRQQSMVLVPMETPGVKVLRPMLVFGCDDAHVGHAEIDFNGVRVPKENLIWGEGRGFEMAQSRLGPGRLHHCMRLVGMAERGVELMVQRAKGRSAFGQPLAENAAVQAVIAKARVDVEAARLMVLSAADALDKVGIKGARHKISEAKVMVPLAAQRVLDAAMQLHGGTGVSDDTPLARLWVQARTLRIADGPDEVHLLSIAKAELRRRSRL